MENKKIIFFIAAILICVVGYIPVSAQTQKHPSLTTSWSSEVSPTNSHLEYPRPSLVRTNWLNLNGLWDFGVTQVSQTNVGIFPGQIIVPFPVESILSRANHPFVTEKHRLWYRRKFAVPGGWQGQRVILHFEAVDWEAEVWVNGIGFPIHRGGYDRFSFDITEALRPQGEQDIVVSVFDPSDSGSQPRGKQMLRPRQPFFSASSGIWQTVWLEPVPAAHIDSLKLVPAVDARMLKVTVFCSSQVQTNAVVEASVLDGSREVSVASGHAGVEFQIPVPDAKLWSPADPFLYNLKLSLICNGEKTDVVNSYFGMRKISEAKDKNGCPQLMLNNQKLFQLGPLDQGYWPDGLYTAPTDEALRYDIETMKKLGFNMCRKHVKIEPERWYYWCDKLGLLVWQDMPNGGHPATIQECEIVQKPEVDAQFEDELNKMIVQHINHPCIVTWVLFNQGWGQYSTIRLTKLCKELDSSRLVISASGWFDLKTGDIASFHGYPFPKHIESDGKRAIVVGECGGLALVTPKHLWGGVGHWNTTYFNDAGSLVNAYSNMVSRLVMLKKDVGISGAVVTQLSDIEAELDGFTTYDRAVIKMPIETVREINNKLLKQE